MIDVDDLEGFCSWIVQHEKEIVGEPGRCFQSPLARWLSEVTGRVYGVDSERYGCASADWRTWRLLPRWAQVLVASSERMFSRAMTGEEVFALLASIELRRFCARTNR